MMLTTGQNLSSVRLYAMREARLENLHVPEFDDGLARVVCDGRLTNLGAAAVVQPRCGQSRSRVARHIGTRKFYCYIKPCRCDPRPGGAWRS